MCRKSCHLTYENVGGESLCKLSIVLVAGIVREGNVPLGLLFLHARAWKLCPFWELELAGGRSSVRVCVCDISFTCCEKCDARVGCFKDYVVSPNVAI